MEEDKPFPEQNIQPFSSLKFNKHFLVGLSILLLLCLTSTGFLFFQNIQLKKQIAQLQVTFTPTLTPAPLPTITPIPTPTELSRFPTKSIIVSPTPTATAATVLIKSSVCPVTFTVSPERIYIAAKDKFGTWQLKDRLDERFMYLPRAEETNGREAEMELRAEGQIYFNGEALVSVHCQDNPNRWNQEDFIKYVKQADFLTNPVTQKTTKWNRQVYLLTYEADWGTPDPVWLFATDETLFHVQKTIYNETFRKQAEEIFETLKFD